MTKETTTAVANEEEQQQQQQHVDGALIEKAVTALLKHHASTVGQEESLLGNDRPIQVQLGLQVAPGQPRKVVRIDIPHAIHQTANGSTQGDEGLEEADVCLIVKDCSKPWIQKMVEDYPQAMGCIKKVLTLDSLRKKHGSYQQRRELLAKYDLFMADDRILPMLTSALGKEFVKAKKLPLPINITRKTALPFAIQKNLASTFMTVSRGTCITIRAGNTGMPAKKLVENVVAICHNAVPKLPRKWANVGNIAVKTPDSTSLPFYNKLPEELLEIAQLAGMKEKEDESKSKDDDNQKDEESPNKRKRDKEVAKSPLVRALKKQKQQENATTTKDKTSEKKKKRKESQELQDQEDTLKSSTKTDKKKKKRRKESEELQEEEETPKQSSRKTDKKKKNKRKDSQDSSIPQPKSEFVASKKFKGSKEGYVFCRGEQGVGYYLDKKPVVDKMMIQALLRASAKQGNGGAAGKRSKSGGKRRGRR